MEDKNIIAIAQTALGVTGLDIDSQLWIWDTSLGGWKKV